MNALTILICILYIISPVDFVPDVIPVVGWVDDVMALLLAIGSAVGNK